MDNPWTQAKHWAQDTEQSQAKQTIKLKRHQFTNIKMADMRCLIIRGCRGTLRKV